MFELIQKARFEGTHAEARAHVGADWSPIADHFPGHPILPGSVQLELCAQVAGPLAERVVKAEHGLERWAFVVMVRNAAFEQPVRLPATLELRATLTRKGPTNTTATVEIFVGEIRTCRAEIVMQMLEPEPTWAAALAEARARVARWEHA
jgi:3-hydroxymyristoyl/3-hydroxydecanoyl-(acyl carrier protein) dehydratase